MNNTDNYRQRSNVLNEFLWWCAGVNKQILRQCPTDYAKYAGAGGTIFFTSVMAVISSSYAIYFVFENRIISVIFGLIWGSLIFNLDRYMVNTMYSDGLPTISWGEIRSGLPRIIMAIFLGVVISTPLEMKVFEDRINSQLVQDNIERTNKSRQKAWEGNVTLVQRRDLLEKEQREIIQRLANANKELKEEGEGTALSGKVGHGPIYKEKEMNRDAIQKELDDWNAAHEQELKSIRNQIEGNTKATNDDIDKGAKENGFCVRYEAFANVKANNTSLQIVSLVIMLLFIIIETAPTFFKMMVTSGPYDDMLRAEMYRVRVMSDKEMSDVNDEVNTMVQISVKKNKEKMEAELAANKEVMGKVELVQAELLQTAISKWREEELKKIEQDPSAYFMTTETNKNGGSYQS